MCYLRNKGEKCSKRFNHSTTVSPKWFMHSQWDEILTFRYKTIATAIGSHPEIDNQWKSANILPFLLSDIDYKTESIFIIRVPLYLHDYNLSFHFTGRNGWISKTQTINICSFLTRHGFEVNDSVVFRDPSTCNSYIGVIQQVLEDDMYDLMYTKYDPFKGSLLDYKAWTQIRTTTAVSTLFAENEIPEYSIQIVNKSQIIKNTIIRALDPATIETYMTLWDALKSHAIAIETKDQEEQQHIAEFMTVSIFDMLFVPQFNYRINCLMEGDDHGRLKLQNVRQTDLRNMYFMKHNNIGDVETDIDRLEDSSYLCDLCAGDISHWSCAFFCCGPCEEQHGFCITCIYNDSIEYATKGVIGSIIE
eukprot:588760_1